MATWFTADLHFGHTNIIRYCDRPFDDADQMNEAMVSGWNERVRSDDTVYVVGDFALGTIAATLPIAGDLAGHKILVVGNHDRCFKGFSAKAQEWEQRYLDAGFEQIIHDRTTVRIGDVTAMVCHFPYGSSPNDASGSSNDDGDSRTGRGDPYDRQFDARRPADDGGWLIHGHIHERWLQSHRMINVGVDVWDFRPASEAEVAALIAAGPRDLSRGQRGSGVGLD